MSEVKSLPNPETAYRHRGWLWADRATYELFKPYMKLDPLIDRLLTGSGAYNLYAALKEDGRGNAWCIGTYRDGVKANLLPCEQFDMRYNVNTNPNNGFIVIAERIRAKKPQPKVPRPSWRQRLTRPWQGATLKDWVLDGSLVRNVALHACAPERADRLYVSTTGGNDTFVWADSRTAPGANTYWATAARGIRGMQASSTYGHDEIKLSEHCHWQLAGVRKKVKWVPEPAVVLPTVGAVPRRPAASPLLAAPYGTVKDSFASGLVPSLNSLLRTNPTGLGHDTYALLAAEAGISRGMAKSMWPILFASDFSVLEERVAAQFASKPALGVKPRNLHDEERANALDEAMVRYLNDDLPFPIEWAVEWNELRARLNKEQK